MTDDDFPALYRCASEVSADSQAAFYHGLRWHLLFLVAAAGISVMNSPLAGMAVAQALVLLGALGCSVYLFSIRPDRIWYAARAVTESIKTTTWRFVACAEPFNTEDQIARSDFLQKLKSIVEQNTEVAKRFSKDLAGNQITTRMMDLRVAAFQARKDAYVTSRIVNQQLWYAKKSAWNKKMASRFFIALIATNCLAIAAAVVKVYCPTMQYWPTDLLIALAAALLSWLQAKRFSELSSSYALAAHEISLIKEQAVAIGTDAEFSLFVSDAENAFSREHTQWVARKDS